MTIPAMFLLVEPRCKTEDWFDVSELVVSTKYLFAIRIVADARQKINAQVSNVLVVCAAAIGSGVQLPPIWPSEYPK